MASDALTLGQKRVQRNLNPSANPQVEHMKGDFANLIDKLEELKVTLQPGEPHRCISIAQTELETACMYAVKSLFA